MKMNLFQFKTNRVAFFALLLMLPALAQIHAQAVLTPKEIARTALPSVVLIICDDGEGKDIVRSRRDEFSRHRGNETRTGPSSRRK